MSKSKKELIASVEAMFGKVENKGKTEQGKFSAAEFNDVVVLLVELANTCSTRTELESALNSLSYYTRQQINQMLTGKQDSISDLDNIRSGAAAAATAYQKPDTGIPLSDLDAAVQASLAKANTAIQELTFDNTPTEGSSNPVKSSGIKSALDVVNGRIDAVIGGNATLSLSATPASIFANTNTTITVSATASTTAASISIKKGGNAFHSGSNVASISKSEVLNMPGGSTVTYSAEAVISGVTKTASNKTVKAYDKIYYGVGTENSYEGITSYQSVRSSAAGTYTFNIVTGKQYAYILVPYAMSAINLNNVKLDSGFGYNLQLISDNVTIDNARYRVYRSAANAVGESFNVVIS